MTLKIMTKKIMKKKTQTKKYCRKTQQIHRLGLATRIAIYR